MKRHAPATLRNRVAIADVLAKELPEQGQVLELASIMNQMLDQTESLMQGVRSVSDNIAHDLRTPLTRLRLAVEMLAETDGWLTYDFPQEVEREAFKGKYRGQKQRWFLLQLVSHPERVRLDTTDQPEFDRWRWVDYWRPVKEVIYFKRQVYVQALFELGPLAFPADGPPPPPSWWPRGWQRALPEEVAG